jgi:hypothetical protein
MTQSKATQGLPKDGKKNFHSLKIVENDSPEFLPLMIAKTNSSKGNINSHQYNCINSILWSLSAKGDLLEAYRRICNVQ